ncbi:hypothetical protein Poli38472_008024 [Pythium oligandrum]|uniref:Uncharacterized protein n=1 Tax=Pythium oligandrum TaxID=41045 RepID=A0A8K1CN24_PYTOL|nr:hypothetical protein Poli38472_008024 [Pythium oligandrum]|eukprot:TMW65382.1 hypothetical protein Poli38472_008024 [Pythium oligandrum]
MAPRSKRSFSASPRHYEQIILLSPLKFALAWTGLLSLHGLCIGYFVMVARVYHDLPGTFLAALLDFYSLGLRSTNYPRLSAIHLALACVHGVFAGLMIIGSLLRRRLVFHPLQGYVITSERRDDSLIGTILRRIYRLYVFFYGRRGVFGVENRYFDLLLLSRECLETVLQSYQAYRLSRFVSRLWLNRVYITLLVLNCWSTPFIHTILKRKVVLSRLCLLLGDALLDLFSSIGLPVILMMSYYRDYDPKISGFAMYFWYNDEWVVHFFNEFQLVLVVSWMDMFSRVVFALGLVGAMENIKALVRPLPTKAARSVGVLVAVAPQEATSSLTFSPHFSLLPLRRGLDRVVFTTLALWGLVVLGLHVHAQTQRDISQCLVQVHPWTATQPACVLLAIDCHLNNVRGYPDDIAPFWALVDPTTVTRIVIRHCPELHMPSKLQEFNRLDTLKLYNSSIVDWSDAAALTGQHHPVVTSLFFVRVNFPDGQLPPGMVSSDFPRSAFDFEFAITNLRSLPDDLDTKWSLGTTIYIEVSQLDHYPSVLTRLGPTSLSLAANRLTEFPVETLQIPGLTFVSFAANPISTLETIPYTDVIDIGVVTALKLMETNISSLPQWLDPLINRRAVNLFHSPFCEFVRDVEIGTRMHFPAVDTTPPDELATVMMLSDAKAIRKAITCNHYYVLLYPLTNEDEWSALTPQPVLYPLTK